jgi:hypothetical protein
VNGFVVSGRSHARARAYIDRARTTLAEGQRRSDELLQASRELLEQGEADEARRLLTEAVAASGDEVQAAALRARLERLERVRALVVSAGHEAPETPAPIEPWSPWLSWRRAIGVGVAVLVILGGAAIFVQSGAAPDGDRALVVTPVTAPAPLPILTSSEVALVRAQNARARGRLSEALRELNRVSPDSPARPAADQFRIEIQQLLLASARSASATTPTEPIKR